MTAHGAKGLQAPLVILADATADPTAAPHSTLRWMPDDDTLALPGPIPIVRPRADERGGPLDTVAAGKINDRRFADVKSNLRYSLLMQLTSADRIAGTLAWNSGPAMDPAFVEKLSAAMASTTVPELQRYVGQWFGKHQRAIVELRHTPAVKTSTGAAR